MIQSSRTGATLSLTCARALLAQYVPQHENWDKHSETVALVAAYVSNALQTTGVDVDKQFAVTAALLHDIGRSNTHHPALHGIAGYEILCDLGYPEYALVCITHVLKGRSLSDAYENGVIPPESLPQGLEPSLSPLTIEHKIVAVADAMVRDTEIVGIRARYERSKERYSNEFISENERLSLQLQASLEEMLRRTICEILSPISSASLRSDNPWVA